MFFNKSGNKLLFEKPTQLNKDYNYCPGSIQTYGLVVKQVALCCSELGDVTDISLISTGVEILCSA